jgi:hypothetical protein
MKNRFGKTSTYLSPDGKLHTRRVLLSSVSKPVAPLISFLWKDSMISTVLTHAIRGTPLETRIVFLRRLSIAPENQI